MSPPHYPHTKKAKKSLELFPAILRKRDISALIGPISQILCEQDFLQKSGSVQLKIQKNHFEKNI